MKKVMKFLTILLLTILTIFILLLIFIPIINDFTAFNVKNSLKNTTLPPKTALFDSISFAGKSSGNGNGMDYFGAILIKSQLTLEELQEHYLPYKKNNWSYIVEQQTSKRIEPLVNTLTTFKNLEDVSDFSHFFIVYSWGNSNFILADFDLRGH